MDRKVIKTEKAPLAIGPYSVAIKVENLAFTSGQIGLDPTTQMLVQGGVQAETRQALNNLKQVLLAAGSDLERVVKTTVFLKDMSDFQAMNSVYAEFFPVDPPARSAVAAAGLPKGANVEIEAIGIVE